MGMIFIKPKDIMRVLSVSRRTAQKRIRAVKDSLGIGLDKPDRDVTVEEFVDHWDYPEDIKAYFDRIGA